MLKNILSLCIFGALLSSTAFAAETNTLAGVPMKHSPQVTTVCIACHKTAVPDERPDSAKCIKCHGEMLSIKTKPNPQGKNPHQSDHYGDTLECASCHAEHKASKEICSNCHVVSFKNFR
jgi:hypothetical protein